MNTVHRKLTELPAWLRSAVEEGECADPQLNKRGEHRYVWVRLASVEPRSDGGSAMGMPVKIANVSSQGVGLISRKPLEESEQLVLTPDGVTEKWAPFESVNVRVIHCTRTVQGYKVGCVFVA
ncbi:MAG: hypothetical protein ACYTFA_13885 [Planctomycetota bacterium]